VAAVSLGCPKNQVDLEGIVGSSIAHGAVATDRAEEADVIIVNTCAFLESAIAETQAEIRRALYLKRHGKPSRIIVAGCFPVYARSRCELIPPTGIDALLAPGEAWRIPELLAEWFPGKMNPENGASNGEVRTLFTPRSLAYVKISDGCDMNCSFCLIPSFRGRFVSRPLTEVADEVRVLVSSGVREIVLVSQDTTEWGKDRGDALRSLLAAIAELPGKFWVRMMYLYPAKVEKALIEFMTAHSERLIPYFDLAIQHLSDSVLQRMRRLEREDAVRALFADIRETVPEATISASVIVGFPGETEDDFALLRRFVAEGNIDRLGVFTYSSLPGMDSHELPDQVPEALKLQRMQELMEIQRSLSRTSNEGLLGRVAEVLVDSRRRMNGSLKYAGRTYRDAFEVNCSVVFTSERRLRPGEFVPVRITEAHDYDLVGRVVD